MADPPSPEASVFAPARRGYAGQVGGASKNAGSAVANAAAADIIVSEGGKDTACGIWRVANVTGGFPGAPGLEWQGAQEFRGWTSREVPADEANASPA